MGSLSLIPWLSRSVKGVGPNLHVARLNVFLFDICPLTILLGHFLPFLGIKIRAETRTLREGLGQ